MKKLLIMIGAIGITASGASNIVSCCGVKTKTVKQPPTSQEETIPIVEKTSQQKPIPIVEKTSQQKPIPIVETTPQEKIQNDINTMVAYELFVNNNTTIKDVKNAVKVDDSHGLFSAIKKTIVGQYVSSKNIFVTNNIYNTNDEYDFTLLKDKDVRKSKNVYVEIKILKAIKVRIRVKLIFNFK